MSKLGKQKRSVLAREKMNKVHPGLLGLTRSYRLKKTRKWIIGRSLDVGCSDGALMSITSGMVGIDPDIEMIKKAKEWGSAYVAGAEKIPFKTGSFDTVACTDVIEHVVDLNKSLNEIARVAKKRIILSFPLRPFRGHPEYLKKIPMIDDFRILHKSYNFAPMSVPVKGDTHFNNEKHMGHAMKSWWFPIFRFFRPVLLKLMEVHGNISKTSAFIVYERVK